MGTKSVGKKVKKAEKLRARRLQLLAVSGCPPHGCKTKCCEKFAKCESKRCKKCPCLDLLQSLPQQRKYCEVA